MPLLGFKAQFVPAIENGLDEIAGRPLSHEGVRPKRQTIRAVRRDGRDPRAGDTLYLYTGLRQKGARKLGEARCTETLVLQIRDRLDSWAINGHYIGPKDRRELAQRDGFDTATDIHAFFATQH